MSLWGFFFLSRKKVLPQGWIFLPYFRTIKLRSDATEIGYSLFLVNGDANKGWWYHVELHLPCTTSIPHLGFSPPCFGKLSFTGLFNRPTEFISFEPHAHDLTCIGVVATPYGINVRMSLTVSCRIVFFSVRQIHYHPHLWALIKHYHC